MKLTRMVVDKDGMNKGVELKENQEGERPSMAPVHVTWQGFIIAYRWIEPNGFSLKMNRVEYSSGGMQRCVFF